MKNSISTTVDRIDYPTLDASFVLKHYEKCVNSISEETLLYKDGEEFIKACYRYFFDRDADEGGFNANLALLNSGMSKEGMIYSFAISEEFKGNKPVRSFELYRNEYLKYAWDVSGLLAYDDYEFLTKCFESLWCKLPTDKQMHDIAWNYYSGLPKEGVLYLFAASDENLRAKSIQNLAKYKATYEAYNEYVHRKSLKRRVRRFLERYFGSRTTCAEMKAEYCVVKLRQDRIMQQIAKCIN